jgi:serine/threonine-protein kinase
VSVPQGGIPFGHFVLHKRLARGGMAEVFLARQRGLEGFDRRVAVKRILPHLSVRDDFVQMFLDEARLAARLSHPNIVHIYEFGKVDDDYFIAMEYVDGVHAGQLIKRAQDERLPPVLVARIGADAASALAYAHRLEDADGRRLEVVHRDISPQNLMISFDGVVKLVDFGIAKAAASASEATQPGVVKGKYAYMSPEQTVGKPLDGRSDVFSLALVLWELLAGRNVVDRGDPADGMRAIRDGRFPPIEQVAPGVPAPLAAAIGHALEVRRDDRSTAAELGVALEAYIKASPDLATAMQLSEWIRARFGRPTTASLPAVPAIEARGARSVGTVVAPATAAAGTGSARAPSPVTRATTSATSVTQAPGSRPWAIGAAAIALPAREATIVHSAIEPARTPARGAPADTLLDDDADDDLAATIERRGPGAAEPADEPDDDLDDDTGHTTIDDATQVVSRPGPATRSSRAAPAPPPPRRSLLPWTLAAVAVLGGAAVVAIVALGGDGPRAPHASGAPRAPQASGAPSVTALAPDAGPQVTAIPADAAPTNGAGAEPAPALAAIDVLTTPSGATARLVDRDAPEMTTPATFVDLTPGTIELVVELAGHATLSRTLTVAAGERRTLELVLTPAAAAVRDPGKDRPRDGGRDRDRDRERAAKKATGTLNVRTSPYSVVYLGGKKLGETPFVKELPAGSYTLTFVNPERGKTTRKVTIEPGKTTKLKFDL